MKIQKIFTLTITILLFFSTLTYATEDNNVQSDNSNYRNLAHKVKRVFNAVDSNEDGLISKEEFLTKKLEKAALRFDKIDSDSDNLISLDEFKSAIHSHWDESIDRDQLRSCIEAELDIELAALISIEDKFSTTDSNADGFIDMNEFTASNTVIANNKFDIVDVNNDESITKREMAEALVQLHTFRIVRNNCLQQQQDLSDILGD